MIRSIDEYYTERLNIPSEKTKISFRPLVFCLQDDELANAFYSFWSFIEENGTDFNQLEPSDLVQAINQNIKKEKNG